MLQLRVYSRELGLNASSVLHVEQLPSAAVTLSITGQDSLLVYTYENVLYHFVVNASNTGVKLVQVGQLALHGIVRAPARVRAVTWILPEFQMRECITDIDCCLLADRRKVKVIPLRMWRTPQSCFLSTQSSYYYNPLPLKLVSNMICGLLRKTSNTSILCGIREHSPGPQASRWQNLQPNRAHR